MQQRIEQRAVGHAIARMHHHAGRLVDHEQRVVLENHVEWNGLRRMNSVCRHAARLEFEPFPGISSPAGIAIHLVVHAHPALA
jgi:hypothetical protein